MSMREKYVVYASTDEIAENMKRWVVLYTGAKTYEEAKEELSYILTPLQDHWVLGKIEKYFIWETEE